MGGGQPCLFRCRPGTSDKQIQLPDAFSGNEAAALKEGEVIYEGAREPGLKEAHCPAFYLLVPEKGIEHCTSGASRGNVISGKNTM